MGSPDKIVAVAYITTACTMLLLTGAFSVLIARSRDGERRFPLDALNRLLHSAACGMGIAAGPVLLSGLFTLLRSSQAAREPR